jgi:hypothetical protein
MVGVVAVGCLAWSATAQAAQPTFDRAAEFAQALTDFDEAQRVQEGRPELARRLFRSAAQRFRSLAASGVSNGRLEYNLGNCHLQAGEVGRAILHFRRAQRLIPGDGRLERNLAEARSRCVSNIPSTRGGNFLGSVLFWHYQASASTRARVAMVVYALFWAIAIVRNFVARRAVGYAAVGCAILAGCLAASVAVTHWSDRNTPEGVVTSMRVMVYKGPGREYQRQFTQPLQPGVEFTLRGWRGDWWRIELADGNSGWIERTRAELIRPATRKKLRT